MNHKVAELEGVLLDAAVAKAERVGAGEGVDRPPWLEYSRDWAAAGPIIQREEIAIRKDFLDPDDPDDYIDTWIAYIRIQKDLSKGREFEGSTPLIAAMRAYVASKLGDEVELP
jgi:hypothetical protein